MLIDLYTHILALIFLNILSFPNFFKSEHNSTESDGCDASRPEALSGLVAPLSLDQMMKELVHKPLDWLLMDGEAEIAGDIITSGKKSVFIKNMY